MAPLLTSQPTNVKWAMEALKAATQVVKVVPQPPPKPHISKPSSASALATPQQPVPQVNPSKVMGSLRFPCQFF